MNFFQRLIVRFAAWIAPPLGAVLRMSGGTVDRLSEQVALYRDAVQRQTEERQSLTGELREAISMSGGGPWRGVGLQESYQPSESDSPAVHRMKEALAELELALEDRGWKRQLALSETEFSRYGIQQIILISRLYFIKNPLIKRGVKVSAMYVFGRGVEISCENNAADKVLQDFLKNNDCELSHSGMVQKEEGFYTDGNLFLAFFTDPVDGSVSVRTIDATEIEEVITNPDDASEHWFYRRRWISFQFDLVTGITTPTMQEAWYVAMDYTPPANIKAIKGHPLVKDKTGQFVPVMHVKEGALAKWHFGCPLVYSALDWARAYKHFLEDWCTITRALARFAWTVETQGGAPAIANFKSILNTTLGNDGTSIETNPPPVVGSAFITGPGNKLTPMKTSNSTSDPEQGRRVLLMVASALDLPETFFGDASTGSLATAQSLDRPTELKFMQRQEKWKEIFNKIGKYVLSQSAMAPGGKLKESQFAEAAAKKEIEIRVDFPSVLEHDQLEAINSIVAAMTLNNTQGQVVGIDEKVGVRELLHELGVEDIETVIEAMYPDSEYDADRTKEPEPPPTPATPQLGPDGKPITPAPAPQPAPQGKQPVKAKAKAKADQTEAAINALKKAANKLIERRR